jgi:hypothetical protein
LKTRMEIWKLVEGREEDLDLLRRALNVGICPNCGENAKREVLHSAAAKYTCACGFSHTREE